MKAFCYFLAMLTIPVFYGLAVVRWQIPAYARWEIVTYMIIYGALMSYAQIFNVIGAKC